VSLATFTLLIQAHAFIWTHEPGHRDHQITLIPWVESIVIKHNVLGKKVLFQGQDYYRLLNNLLLTSSCQCHKDWATSSVFLLPYMKMKFPLPILIWLHTQPCWKQNLIVWFALFDFWERLLHHISTQCIRSHEAHPHVELFVLYFMLYFVKPLRWWGVTIFT
jgi:hypothetical protein